MEPLTLFAVGALALLLFGGKKRPPPQEKSKPPPPRDGSGPSFDATLPPVIGAGLALSGVGAVVGEKLTGTKAGAALGALNPVTGNVINLGTAVGAEIDKAFGGDGRGATGIVAKATGGTSFGVGFALGPVFGPLASISLAISGAIVYAVVGIVDDINKLAYGQQGAFNDLVKKMRDVFNAAVQTDVGRLNGLRKPRGLEKATGIKDVPIYADRLSPLGQYLAWLYALEFVIEKNRMAYNAWNARPAGFEKTEYDHAVFGADRGYFVGRPKFLEDLTGGKFEGQDPNTMTDEQLNAMGYMYEQAPGETYAHYSKRVCERKKGKGNCDE